ESSRRAASDLSSSARPIASGSEGSAPAIIASSSAASATERASEPWVSRYGQVGTTPVRGTSPNGGLMPTTPVQTPRLRMEPPAAVWGGAEGSRAPARTRGPGAGPAGCASGGGVVRVAHLPRVAARAFSAIGKVVCRRLAEHDRTGCAKPRDLDRIAPDWLSE